MFIQYIVINFINKNYVNFLSKMLWIKRWKLYTSKMCIVAFPIILNHKCINKGKIKVIALLVKRKRAFLCIQHANRIFSPTLQQPFFLGVILADYCFLHISQGKTINDLWENTVQTEQKGSLIGWDPIIYYLGQFKMNNFTWRYVCKIYT